MRFAILFLSLSVSVLGQVRAGGAGNLPPGANTPQAPPGIPGQPQEAPPVADCAIAGRVLSVTGEPLNKATVTLRQVFSGPSTGQRMPASYTSTSDTEGKFVMTEIPPGSYHLRAERNGFVTGNYGSRSGTRGGTTLALTQGQSLAALEIKLAPHAVITGRVVDIDGEPVARAMVSALRYRYAQGGRQLMPAESAQTDDRGEYRIFGLQPGRYYVSAMDGASRFRMPSEDRSAGPRVNDAYVTTYYPGTPDVETASQLEAAAGRELQEVNLKLSRVRTVRVRGRVIDETGIGNPSMPMMIVLRQRNSFGPGNMTQSVAGAGGLFEFRGLLPGSYILAAVVRDGEVAFSGRQQIDVGTRDMENVLLPVRKGVEIGGMLQVEGTPIENLAGLRVMLRPAESGLMFTGPPNGRVDASGNFVLENTGPEQYLIMVAGLPPGYYVKSARMGREDVLENAVDLTRGGGALEIVLADGAGEVEGAVMGSDQKPFPGATVVLVPDSEARRKIQQFYKTATTDQAGRYKLSSIDPGGYRIYAFDDVENGEWMDPDLINSVRSRGTDVRIQQGGRQTLELKVIGSG